LPTTDQELVQHALAGDSAAKRALAVRLLTVISREVGFLLTRRAAPTRRDPRQELRDLSQDVLVLLFEQDGQELARWDPARGRSLDSFVQLVTRRRVARILTGGRGNPWVNDPTAPEDMEGLFQSDLREVEELEARHQLAGVLEALQAEMSTRDAEIFEMMYVEEMAPEEVCARMDMTRAALNTWRYRLRKLAKSLADETRSEPRPSPTMKSQGETAWRTNS
jgi:DNA-directed RNA polymerase specialized sigma24 family protein